MAGPVLRFVFIKAHKIRKTSGAVTKMSLSFVIMTENTARASLYGVKDAPKIRTYHKGIPLWREGHAKNKDSNRRI